VASTWASRPQEALWCQIAPQHTQVAGVINRSPGGRSTFDANELCLRSERKNSKDQKPYLEPT